MSRDFKATETKSAEEAVLRGMEVVERMQHNACKRIRLSLDPEDSLRRVKQKKQAVCQNTQTPPPATREETSGDAPTTLAVSMASVPIAANYARLANARLSHAIAVHKADIRKASIHSRNVLASNNKLRQKTAARGCQYKKNTEPSRGGFMAETVLGESVNVDAKIKCKNVRAVVPSSNRAGSADIIITDSAGSKTPISVKVYKDPSSSARAQTDPLLDGQRKVIPTDQVTEGKAYLEKRADREVLRGRPDAAARQRDTANGLSDIIEVDGVESVRLTRKNAIDLSKSVTVDENGEAVVDMAKLDAVLDETGITKKVERAVEQDAAHIEKCKVGVEKARHARVRAEIKGAAAAAGIAALTTAATTVAVTLIENGVSMETLHTAAINGAHSGAEGGVVALGVYGAVRTVGASLCNTVAGTLTNAGVIVTENIAAGIGVGVMGAVASAAVSAYTLVRMKAQGASTGEALVAVGKNVAVSMGITVAAGVATLTLGAAAGAMVSAAIGMGMIGFSLFKAFRSRRSEGLQGSYATGWRTACPA